MDEPVSPELALVDPDLARRLRAAEMWRVAHLAEAVPAQPLQLDSVSPESVPAPTKPRSRRLRIALPALCAVAGFVAGVATIELDRPAVQIPQAVSSSPTGVVTPT